MKNRPYLNAHHRMTEMGISNIDLVCLLGVTRQTLHMRCMRMTQATLELLTVLLVLPAGALEAEDPGTVVKASLPNMFGWHACMYSVLRQGEPYPDTVELLGLCDAFGQERERGVVIDPTGV